jgi:hypothetical protein
MDETYRRPTTSLRTKRKVRCARRPMRCDLQLDRQRAGFMMRPSDAALFQRAPILRGSLALVKTTMELEMRTMIPASR